MKQDASTTLRSVLRHLDPRQLREATRAETRSRQRHLPPITTYRWWARRTETVTGAVVDAVAADARDRDRLLIADLFAGGGVIALAAMLRGHRVYAQDVNPWAARGLTTMLSLPDAGDLQAAADEVHERVAADLERAYATTLSDGTPGEMVHALRVATSPCLGCGETLRLFPTGLVSQTTRVDCGGTQAFVACPAGHTYVASATKRSRCPDCRRLTNPTARYTQARLHTCFNCGTLSRLSDLAPYDWEVVLVEKVGDAGREIVEPTRHDLTQANDSSWSPCRHLGTIADGVETRVLREHGMSHWDDLYPARQRVILETVLEHCKQVAGSHETLRAALEAAVIGSAEMAGLCSRWDPRYLKAYEAIANHRFNFTTLAAEPNVWGAHEAGRGTIRRRIEHLAKAAIWLEEHLGRRPKVTGPLLATERRSVLSQEIDARIVVGSSDRLVLQRDSVDAVITDPPYHDDVHYGELSALFRTWAGLGTSSLDGDAVVRRGHQSDTRAYETLLTSVFTEAARVLRPGGHLVLSYANRNPVAWTALLNALQNAGFHTLGFTYVDSENETDHAKAGRRACTQDLLLDLVTDTTTPKEQLRPSHRPRDEEQEYCAFIGEWALRVGSLRPGWEQAFVDEAMNTAFLS